MNRLDVIILAVLALSALLGYHKGLLRTVYKMATFVAATIIARQFYPYLANIIRQSPLFGILQDIIRSAMDLNQADLSQAEGIDNLPLPNILQNMLRLYNTPNMFEVFQVSTIGDFVASFLANMLVNGMSMLLLFLACMIVFGVVGKLLNFVMYLPVIGTINRIGGFTFGLVLAAVTLWVGLVVAAIFVAPTNEMFYGLVNESFITQFVFERTLPQLARVE